MAYVPSLPMHGCSKASLPASLETSLQATQDASGTSQAEGEERCTAFQQTPTSISLRGDQAPCGTGVHHAAAHRLSEHRLRRARVGSPWHREQSAHRPEGLDKHTHTCSLLAVETCQKGNSPLTGSTRDSAHRRNLSLSAHVQPALATALLILVSIAAHCFSLSPLTPVSSFPCPQHLVMLAVAFVFCILNAAFRATLIFVH